MNAIFKHARRSLALFAALILAASGAGADVLKGRAPDFSLASPEGKNVSLAALKGDVVMVNFWASWCAPCRQEMPLLDAMYKRFKPLGFTLVGINVDEEPNAARALLREVPVSFPIGLDSAMTVSAAYQVMVMPTTVFIDRKGAVRHVHQGYRPGDEAAYEQQLRLLLKE